MDLGGHEALIPSEFSPEVAAWAFCVQAAHTFAEGPVVDMGGPLGTRKTSVCVPCRGTASMAS